MELIPAIDLLDGQVVRLRKGDYDSATVYGDNPVEVARGFAEAGAQRLHVVDLEGARSGMPCHLDEIRRILRAVDIQVQVGGGIRSVSSAERWLSVGAQRVVLGTVAVREPAVAQRLCDQHPGRVVIALDARGDEVAVDAWTRGSGRDLTELAHHAEAWGAAAILYTDIARDGTGAGPAVDSTSALQEEVGIPVIASGGIGTLEHIRLLREAGVQAAIAGRGLYEGAFSLDEGLRVAAGEG